MNNKNQNKKKGIEKNKTETARSSQPVIESKIKKSTIHSFMYEMVVLLLIFLSIIYYVESKGYFSPDATNNHTKRKWESFYQFTENNNVDILIVGNSHAYTGLNPKNLSTALGANAFILAAPGTTSMDSYYCLEEALTVTKPKVVVMETFGISNQIQHELKDGGLSDQMQSFAARKNISLKLQSTPVLFNFDNYVYAWSNSIRNHNFIFTNREQIEKNIALADAETIQDNRLYLGQYIRWTTGIEDSTLNKYKTLGAPVHGNDYTISTESETTLKKITALCEKNDIKLIFLTIPMYYQHIDNYKAWKDKLSKAITQYSGKSKWIDLQEPYDSTLFTPECFENTYSSNQHLAYHGSLRTTYQLAAFINENKPALPDRTKEQSWHQLFYGDDGYYENFSPVKKDPACIVAFENVTFDPLHIKEGIIVNKNNSRLLLVKINKNVTLPNGTNSTINCLFEVKTADGKTVPSSLQIPLDKDHLTLKYYLFSTPINSGVDITRILQCRLN